MEIYLILSFLIGFKGVSKETKWSKTTFALLLLCLTLFIGLRYIVGGDWDNYIKQLYEIEGDRFPNIFSDGSGVDFFIGKNEFNDSKVEEPAWYLLRWFSLYFGAGIYFANTISAFIFSFCLLYFCKKQPNPWLALVVSFPYLIVVVAMGYTRQSVALGFEMVGLLFLQEQKLFPFIALISLASTFHRTVLVMLIIPFLSMNKSLKLSNLLRIILLSISFLALYTNVFAPILSSWLMGYSSMESDGAWIRVILCLIPAGIFLTNKNKFNMTTQTRKLWTIISIGPFLCITGLILNVPSSLIDRIALYLIPLQIVVGSHLPDTGFFKLSGFTWRRIITIFSSAVLFIWLQFANNSLYWIPYQNILLRT